jgi:hypothetical protein
MIYFRMLVSQTTNHVVWIKQESSPPQYIPRRLPNVCKDLDHVVMHIKLEPSMFQWYKEFKDYRLVKPHGVRSLLVEDLPEEYRKETVLARAKCYAMESVINSVSILREKQDLIYNPFRGTTEEEIVPIYQRQLNINAEDAKKLFRFKQEELDFNEKSMQLAEIESELMIANARTVEEVVDIFGYISNKFLTVKTSEFNDLIQIN